MSKKKRKARRLSQRKKVQKRFKARVKAGKSGLTGGAKGTKTNKAKRGQPDTSTIGKYRAAQRAQVRSAAEARNKAFQNKRAGLDSKKLGAGLDSQKLGAEATRLTGIPSGDKLPAGAFGFSAAGRAQAEANKARKRIGYNDLRIGTNVASAFSAGSGLFGDDIDVGDGVFRTKDQIIKMRDNPQNFNLEPGSRLFKQIQEAGKGLVSEPNTNSSLLASTNLSGLAPKTIAGSEVGFDRDSFNRALEGNYDPDSGGLNIGTATGKTSRVLKDLGDAFNTYKGIFNDASAIKNALTPKQQFATFREDAAEQKSLNKASTPLSINSKDVLSDIKSLLKSGMNYKDVANTLSDTRAVVEGGAKAFKNLSRSDQENLVKSAGGIIDNSKVFDSLGVQYTGTAPRFSTFREDPNEQAALNNAPSAFKTQTQSLLAAANKTLKEASQDTKGRVDPINNLLKNFNKIEGYETGSRFLKQQENPNLTFREKIQAAYDPTSPKADALSFEDRNFLGSAGNLLIGGKLSDVFRANNPTERGTTFTPTDSANLIANTMIAANTPGSLTQQRFNEIGALTGQGTKVTPGTLIRGVNPFRRNNRGNAIFPTPRFFQSGGRATTTPVGQLPQVPNPAQVELPVIPQQQEQQGLDPNTLVGIQNQSYQNTFNNLMAQFRPRRMGERLGFKTFNRDYFSQFV